MYKNVLILYMDGKREDHSYVSDIRVHEGILIFTVNSGFNPTYKHVPLVNVREYLVTGS